MLRPHWLWFQIAAAICSCCATGICSSADIGVIPSGNVCTSSSLTFVGSCESIRARLQRGADTISVWVWPVGTKRYLGYPDWAKCELPSNVARLLQHHNVLYANIVIRPLSYQEPNHMQLVCIASATHVVIDRGS